MQVIAGRTESPLGNAPRNLVNDLGANNDWKARAR